MQELEVVRAALLTSFGASIGTDTGQVSVVAMEEGWGAAAGPLLDGLFAHALFSPHIIIRAGSSLVGQSVVKHELVHHLSHFIRPREPAWLAEGLAMYFETLELAADKQLVTVGRPPPGVAASLRSGGIMSVNQLRAGAAIHDSESGFYPSAWLLVHYLMNHRSEALRAYQNALADTANESEAWDEAFASLTPAELDGQLRGYLDGGRYYVYNFPFSPRKARFTDARALTVHDGRATRALVYSVMSGYAKKTPDVLSRTSAELEMCARQETDEVIARDRGHPLALAVKAWELGDQIEASAAQNSTMANPSNWMAWWLLATTLRAHGINDDRFGQAAEKARALSQGNRAVRLDGR